LPLAIIHVAEAVHCLLVVMSSVISIGLEFDL